MGKPVCHLQKIIDAVFAQKTRRAFKLFGA